MYGDGACGVLFYVSSGCGSIFGQNRQIALEGSLVADFPYARLDIDAVYDVIGCGVEAHPCRTVAVHRVVLFGIRAYADTIVGEVSVQRLEVEVIPIIYNKGLYNITCCDSPIAFRPLLSTVAVTQHPRRLPSRGYRARRRVGCHAAGCRVWC